MTDFFSHPDDFGEIQQSELHASLGESLGAQAKDSLDPKNSLSGMYILRRMREENAGGGNIGVPGAGGELDVFSGQPIEERQAASDAFRAAVPETSIADAKSRVKQEGLEQHLKLPEQPSIKSPVLDLMISEAHERRDREVAIARGPQGFVPGALGLVTSIGAGMIDPVNAAAFSVPVLGEARMGKLLASAGDSIINRAGIRAIEGGVQGAAGTALLQPADWWLHSQDGQDYTFADALKSIALGAGMGAGFHTGIGAFGDIRARRRGDILPGSPADLLQQGLMAGTHVTGEALASEGMTADEVAANIEQLLGGGRRQAPTHPAEILEDLPPAAREDAVRSAVADVIADRPVRAGEMLNIAADHDPRIAESFEAWHGSPHDFDRFDLAKVGTGEGAQVYGYGHYFAEKRAVAEDYQRNLTSLDGENLGRFESLGEQSLDISGPAHERIIKGGEEAARRELEISKGDLARARASGVEDVAPIEREKAALEKLIASGNYKAARGVLYKVRISANHEHFLDWDKPISEQTAHVRQALHKVAEDVIARDPADAHDVMHAITADEKVDTFYERLADALKTMKKSVPDKNGFYHFDMGHAAASRVLHEAGLPGIKYLDQGSRPAHGGKGTIQSTGSGKFNVLNEFGDVKAGPFDTKVEAERAIKPTAQTRNFVLFDDKHIEITDKNGEVVKLPAPASDAAPQLPSGPKPRGRGAAHPDTLSLNEHLASRGGLRPDPELEAIYGNKRGPFVPGFGPLIRKTGMSLDDALSSAKQHGYMSDPHDADNGTAGTGGRTSHGLTPNDLLDHRDAENRGRKLYKAGHLEATKYDAAQEKHVIMGALETELERSGADVSAIDPKLLDRTVEIVHREGVSDVLDAYERAIMEDEERYNAIADARRSDPAVADLPGFDDRGSAPGNGGRDQGGDRQAGRPEQGRGRADDSQPSSHGARSAAAAADPRWRELGDVKPAYDDPQAVAESQAADAVTEPASVTPKAITAIERAATEAEEAWRQVEDSYTDKEKALVNDALATIDAERKETEDLIKEGAACLAAAEAV